MPRQRLVYRENKKSNRTLSLFHYRVPCHAEYSSGPNEPPFNKRSGACGPAPLSLLRQGLYKSSRWNADFIGGETNCVVVEHFPVPGSNGKKFTKKLDKVKVGKYIYTSLPASKCNKR